LQGPFAQIPTASVLTRLNECPIASVADWRACFVEAMETRLTYCSLSLSLDTTCCSANYSGTQLCLNHTGRLGCYGSDVLRTPCVPARACAGTCLAPVLPPSLHIWDLRFSEPADAVLYLGAPEEIWYSLDVQDWHSYSGYLPALPRLLETMLQYIASLSAALGVLNAAPIYYLDGHHLTSAVLGLAGLPPLAEARLASALLLTGSLLFGCNMIVSFNSLLN
jgi:hypothetical protein